MLRLLILVAFVALVVGTVVVVRRRGRAGSDPVRPPRELKTPRRLDPEGTEASEAGDADRA